METLSLAKNSLDEIISRAASHLAENRLVLYPSDTIYGIAADPTSSVSIQKLLDYKRQRNNKPISIAVADRGMAEQYVQLNDQAQSLYATLLPGPFTIVSMSLHTVDSRCETIQGTLGVRIPDFPLVTALAKHFGKPITATSANASYQKQPRSIADVLDGIDNTQKAMIGMVIDGGTLPKRDPSTVLDTTVGEVHVLRQGAHSMFASEERFTSHDVAETITFAERLMHRYMHYLGYKSVIFCLMGEMGAGKTHFTKGLARSLSISQELSSPTFVLSQEYAIAHQPGSYAERQNPKFYHMDLWRIRDVEELEGLHFQQLVEEGNIFSIEWADRALEVLRGIQHDAILVGISIEYGSGIDERIITVRVT